MTIRPRGSSFMVDVKVAAHLNPSGQDVRIRVTVKSRDEALRMEGVIRNEIERTGTYVPPDPAAGKLKKGDGTLKAALEVAWNHSTKGWKLAEAKSGKLQYANALQVIDFLGHDTMCAEIDESHFNRAVEHFGKGRGNSNDTVVRKLQAFYRVLWFSQKMGWIKARPEWERPSPAKPRQFIFTPTMDREVEAFFREVQGDDEMADLFVCGIEAGCRLGELQALTGGDVDLGERYLYVRESKNDEPRTVIITDRCKAALESRIAIHGKGLLFPNISKTGVSRRMRIARDEFKPGDREFTFHATRHTCGTRMAEAEMPVLMMMEQMGHKTEAMTRRYVKMSPAARKKAILRAMQGA